MCHASSYIWSCHLLLLQLASISLHSLPFCTCFIQIICAHYLIVCQIACARDDMAPIFQGHFFWMRTAYFRKLKAGLYSPSPAPAPAARARSPRPHHADEEYNYRATTSLIIFGYFASFKYFWKTFGSTIINMLDVILAFIFNEFQRSLFLLFLVVFSPFGTIYYRRKALLKLILYYRKLHKRRRS